MALIDIERAQSAHMQRREVLATFERQSRRNNGPQQLSDEDQRTFVDNILTDLAHHKEHTPLPEVRIAEDGSLYFKDNLLVLRIF